MNDIILTSGTAGLDLEVSGGDLVIGESLVQAQQLLLLTSKGEWKQDPTAGVGIVKYVETADESGMMREIRQQMERDGMEVRGMKMEDGKLTVSTEWK